MSAAQSDDAQRGGGQSQGPQSDGGGPQFILSPATRMLWRSPDIVHFEQGTRAVVVQGLATSLVRRLAAPRALATSGKAPGGVDGRTADSAAVRADPTVDIDDDSAAALQALAEAGYLWTRPHDPDDLRFVPPAPRLAGDLTALAARHGATAAVVLNGRRQASVEVHGAARVAPTLAAVLAAAGVGRVRCVASGNARLRHAAPGGLLPADEGHPLTAAAEHAIKRAAPESDTRALSPDEVPDLTVLALDGPVPDERRAALHAVDAAHLVVSVGADHGAVGPLVVPGFTSCLQCADLHRRDRDPAWPALAVQLSVAQRYGPASDVALGTVIAGMAALQALDFLDGGEPAAIDASLELHLPDWRVRRRTRTLHPQCDCTLGVG